MSPKLQTQPHLPSKLQTQHNPTTSVIDPPRPLAPSPYHSCRLGLSLRRLTRSSRLGLSLRRLTRSCRLGLSLRRFTARLASRSVASPLNRSPLIYWPHPLTLARRRSCCCSL
uniref:Uncharacterized protein n=1 Tax=Kalanchoe fedtschenkoi TaxID=63787 RepID=A0A7N0UQY3_KALFE